MELRPICRVVSGHGQDTFVGVRAQDGKVEVLFPVGYRLPKESACRQAIVRLLMVLSDAVKYAKQQGRLEELELSGFNVDSPIWAYVYLLRLHAEKGHYYSEQSTVYTLNGIGKTDWRRTVQSRAAKPICTGTGQWLFPKRVTRRTTRKEEGVLTLIHRYCVAQSDALLGWLFGTSVSEQGKLPAPLSVCTAAVRQAMERTHKDAEKDLFRAMLCVLGTDVRTQAERKKTYGTCKFDIAWEMLVRRLFGNRDETAFFPMSQWFSGEGAEPETASSLRPDTILCDGDAFYVLDAKYYHMGKASSAKRNMPSTADVNKQLTYAEFVSCKTGYAVVYNAFLLPCDSAKEPMRPDGWNVPEWKLAQLKELPVDDSTRYFIVSAIRLDIAWLIEYYGKHAKGTEALRRRLAQMIQENYVRALTDVKSRTAASS